MTAASRSRLPVDVRGDVSVRTPAGIVSVAGRGETLRVTVPRFRHALRAAFGLPRAARGHHLTQLSRGLSVAGIELSFRIDRWEIARIGAGTGTGLVARGLSLPGVRFRVGALLAALLSRP